MISKCTSVIFILLLKNEVIYAEILDVFFYIFENILIFFLVFFSCWYISESFLWHTFSWQPFSSQVLFICRHERVTWQVTLSFETIRRQAGGHLAAKASGNGRIVPPFLCLKILRKQLFKERGNILLVSPPEILKCGNLNFSLNLNFLADFTFF